MGMAAMGAALEAPAKWLTTAVMARLAIRSGLTSVAPGHRATRAALVSASPEAKRTDTTPRSVHARAHRPTAVSNRANRGVMGWTIARWKKGSGWRLPDSVPRQPDRTAGMHRSSMPLISELVSRERILERSSVDSGRTTSQCR